MQLNRVHKGIVSKFETKRSLQEQTKSKFLSKQTMNDNFKTYFFTCLKHFSDDSWCPMSHGGS